jgi:hypothetical protein
LSLKCPDFEWRFLDQKKGDEIMRIVMLIVLLTMLVSLGGCFWGFEGRGRGGRP